MDREELHSIISSMSVYELFDFIKGDYIHENGIFSKEHSSIRNWNSPYYIYISIDDLSKNEIYALCRDTLVSIIFYYIYVTKRKSFPITSFFVVEDILKGNGNVIMINKKSVRWFSRTSFSVFDKKGINTTGFFD